MDGPAIEELTKCPKLQTVDLTHNLLSGEDVLDELSKISTLLTLSITGNEVTRIQSFRKKAITMVKSLCLHNPQYCNHAYNSIFAYL